ncbi:MAG TPA: (E)-4-hydroxy-3-methylbut-2-enyl-diphosphate synthase [Candidatus Krumholzibacteria bacterium]|nr:(E)-4-hydroxy-3-methylbut-2-enyl-diphosphate synthase [Candidatus Krumholzibacteria bacterium]
MPEAFVNLLPQTPADWQRLWDFTLDPFRTVRRRTREVRVGTVGIGGDNPVRIQSMTIADTMDTGAVTDEIAGLARAGCEIVRVTAPHRAAAENLAAIRAALRRQQVHVPLVADVHFTPQAAMIAAEHVEKVRINPGNYADRKHFKQWEYSDSEYAEELERLETAFRPLVLRCKERGVAMRIGTNHGSLSDRILNRYGDTPLGMVESALEFVRICEHHGYFDLVLSMKASDVKVMIAAYRLLASRLQEHTTQYPLHLGVTEAGGGAAARVKSAIGIATLLADGIGDTVRVSLTEDSLHELPVARALVAPFAAVPIASGKAPSASVPRWDPYFFTRRKVTPLGHGSSRLACDQPPRIEVVRAAPATWDAEPGAWLGACAGADLVLITATSQELPYLRGLTRFSHSSLQQGAQAVGIELPAAWLHDPGVAEQLRLGNWMRISLLLEELHRDTFAPLRGLEAVLQYTVAPGIVPQLAALAAEGSLPVGALALLPSTDRTLALHDWRRAIAAWPNTRHAPPAVLRAREVSTPGTSPELQIDRTALETAWELGALLADGIGDAVQLPSGPEPVALELGVEILQATRARLSKADFIACPSCGRTQFDLQTTTARIEARLRHLRGLKIAVMGCIVNGPGEMADADFGYVGSGPGRIDLYVGHERVERSVPEAEAVTRLVDLIRRNGKWLEPEQK